MTVSMPYDARMLRSRAALRGALLNMLGREPFDTITIRDIAREAGVGAATFYRHYKTKTDLLADIAAQEMEAMIDVAVPVLRTSGSQKATIALCRYVEGHKKVWSALFTGGAAGAMRVAFQNHILQVRPHAGMQRLKTPLDLGLLIAASGLIEGLSWWLRDGQEYDAEQAAEFLYELVVAPGSTR